jgi:hypothetical protein
MRRDQLLTPAPSNNPLHNLLYIEYSASDVYVKILSVLTELTRRMKAKECRSPLTHITCVHAACLSSRICCYGNQKLRNDNDKFHARKQFVAYFPYFEKMRVGLWDLLAVCVSLYLWIRPPPINCWMPETVMCIMPPEPISSALLINSSHHFLYLHVYPSYRCSVNTFSRQRKGTALEKLLEACVCVPACVAPYHC